MTIKPKIDLLEIGNKIANFFYDEPNSGSLSPKSLSPKNVVNIEKWEDFLEKFYG